MCRLCEHFADEGPGGRDRSDVKPESRVDLLVLFPDRGAGGGCVVAAAVVVLAPAELASGVGACTGPPLAAGAGRARLGRGSAARRQRPAPQRAQHAGGGAGAAAPQRRRQRAAPLRPPCTAIRDVFQPSAVIFAHRTDDDDNDDDKSLTPDWIVFLALKPLDAAVRPVRHFIRFVQC